MKTNRRGFIAGVIAALFAPKLKGNEKTKRTYFEGGVVDMNTDLPIGFPAEGGMIKEGAPVFLNNSGEVVLPKNIVIRNQSRKLYHSPNWDAEFEKKIKEHLRNNKI